MYTESKQVKRNICKVSGKYKIKKKNKKTRSAQLFKTNDVVS